MSDLPQTPYRPHPFFGDSAKARLPRASRLCDTGG